MREESGSTGKAGGAGASEALKAASRHELSVPRAKEGSDEEAGRRGWMSSQHLSDQHGGRRKRERPQERVAGYPEAL